MTFLDHLAELRRVILVCVFAVVIGAVVAHIYHDTLIAILLRPIGNQKLFFLSPLDPLLFILKVDIYGGIVLAMPVINWSIFSFVRPAISRFHWLLFSIGYCLATTMLIIGVLYAYFIIVPVSLAFLTSIQVGTIENLITANSYLSFLLVQSLIIMLIFQIPLFIIAGSFMGMFDISSVASKRRHIYLIGLIVLSIITPTTDLFNLGILAIPASLFFEASIFVSYILHWFRKRSAVSK